MVSLTLEQILQLHALVLVKDGGADGVRDVGRLEAAVSTQHQVVFGEELYARRQIGRASCRERV